MEFPEKFDGELTQEHIDKGKRGSCSHCPIALLLMDKFDGYNFTVYPRGVVFTDDSYNIKVSYTHDGADFIHMFDGGKQVNPRTIKFCKYR